MLVEIIIGALAEASLSFGSKKAKQLLDRKNAPQELAALCATSVEASILIVPALANDLRSVSFVKEALLPIIHAIIEDPSHLPDPQGLSTQYVDMFVARFANSEGVDVTLGRIFQTNKGLLVPAFEAFFATLRSEFYKSDHWREIAHYHATEQTLSNTGQILSILKSNAETQDRNQIDLSVAANDAVIGSAELRSWPKDIFGQRLNRPEMLRLVNHVENEPAGTSLLIGEAGSGKSALLAELTERLEHDGLTVFAIKADTLPPDVRTIADIGRALGMAGFLEAEITALGNDRRVVLVIDQLDAVSDVMDRSSARMRLLLQLVRQVRDAKLNIHVIVSSRPFEAAHDARFQQLDAEDFKLELPSVEQISELLQALDINTSQIDPALKQTLRRPFALKLFAELAKRGADVTNLISSQLLDRWLATANLGTETERTNSIALMHTLAAEMITTESLWRPIDRFEAGFRDALARCEACGLLVRSGNKLGFSHQSWLDDFQAKNFITGSDLAEYAWRNQGSLFVRAALLRGLQRLRMFDQAAYLAALDALLGSSKTRRHIRHLIVDVLSANANPLDREVAWIETLVSADKILANRALGQVSTQWEAWRPFLRHKLATLMIDEEFRWRAIQLLAAEAKFDPDQVTSLIDQHWDAVEFDQNVFAVLERSGLITASVEARLGVILERTSIDRYGISHFVTTLRTDERFEDAAKVVGIWARTVEVGRHSDAQLYDIKKLAEVAPLEFARIMLPWFIAVAHSEIEEDNPLRRRFPKSQSLPWNWNFDHERDSLFEALRIAMKLLAANQPSDAIQCLNAILPVEIEQIQELAAEMFAAGAASFSEMALEFLLSDARRFCIGNAHVELEAGVSSCVMGLISHELVGAIAPFLSHQALIMLRDKIEDWSLYGTETSKGTDPKTQQRRLGWADEHRMELLERLPESVVPARRRRQIAEWRGHTRKPIGRTSGSSMATMVGSPMSEHIMAKANDAAILKMLDEVSDSAPERSRRRPLSMEGGVRELARAFAAFGKGHPERAINIAKHQLRSGDHEMVAGALIIELAAVETVPPETMLALLYELSARGFDSPSWRHDAAWALSKLSGRMQGLANEALTLLESWLECDDDKIAEQIKQRLEFEDRNKSDKKAENRPLPEPILFHRGRGMRILPNNNFTILSAIAHGLLSKSSPDYDGWLSALERHVTRAEDPAIWSALLKFEGRWLFWADRPRAQQLIRALWQRDKSIFDDVDMVTLIWPTRAMFPDDVLRDLLLYWLRSDDEQNQQGGAEFITIGNIVAPDNAIFSELVAMLDQLPSPSLTGQLFAATAAWREDNSTLHAPAHSLLMRFTSSADGDQAHAISSAVDYQAKLKANELTKELVSAIAENPALLAASLNGRFADGLQGLLLYHGFDDLVLNVTEKIADLILSNREQRHSGLVQQNFVHVSVALQRSDGPMRERAMDVYERLLDAGTYGAEETAKAAAGR